MWEWLSGNWWAVWLIAATVLAVAESLTLDFTLLMLAAGIVLLALLSQTGAVGQAPWTTTALEAVVRERMGNAVAMAVPLDVSVGVGRSWHEAAH